MSQTHDSLLQNLPPDIVNQYHYAALYIAPRSKKWRTLKKMLEQKVKTFQEEDNLLALFQPNQHDFEVLYNSMLISEGWKSVTYYLKGRPISSKQVWYPVACISSMKSEAGKRESCICKSTNYDDYQNDSEYLRVFTVPCREISRQWYSNQVGDNYREQFLSTAQKWGVADCPFFDISPFSGPEFKKKVTDGIEITIPVSLLRPSEDESKTVQNSKSEKEQGGVLSWFRKKFLTK